MKRKNFISLIFSVLFSAIFVAVAAYASTTISTNISTGGTLTVSGTATSTFSTGGLTVGTSQFVVQQNSGNVGIGTTSPAYKLDVDGTINSSGAITQNGIGLVPYTGATSDVDFGTNGLWTNQIYAPASNLSITSETSYVDLQPANYVYITSGLINVSAILDTSGLTTINKTFTFPNWSGNFLIASSTSLNVSTTGNIGIGTTSPAYKLDIFSAGTTTMRVDSNSASKGSCLKLKDLDGSGYTYCVVNNGVMTCSATSCE